MGPNFEQNPQDGSPSRGDFASYSAYLSSVFNQVTAATPTDNVATVTSAAASDDHDNQHTSVPTARTSQSYPETLSRQTQIPVNTYSITTSGSSLPPSTFATATSAGTQTRTPNSATVTAHAENNSSASAFHADHHDDGLSHGELAAAIVVPIITSLSIIVLAIMCLRRRQKTKRASTSSDASRGTKRSFSGAAAGLKEKWGSVRSSASSQHREPVITSASNNAYMTGLDTSLRSNSPQQQQHHHSGEFYLPNHETHTGEIPPPPPPYILGAPSIPPLTISLPPSRRPSAVDLHDHDHELSHLYLAAPSPAFLDSSARSINSDVYSETASVHSARAARMSIGGPITVPMLNTSKSRATMKDGGSGNAKRNSDPFGDPLTPISAMTPVGVRSRQGSSGTS